MKNLLTLTLLFFAVNVFGQSSPTVKKITDYTPYSSPIGAGGFMPISINNATRSVEAYWINRGSFDSVKLRIDSVKAALGGKVNTQGFLDSLTAHRAAIAAKFNTSDTAAFATGLRTWVNAQNFLKTESDPKRVTAIAITGTNTKTVTLTFADNTTATGSFTDLQSSGGSGGFTFTGLSTDYTAGDGSYINFNTAVNNNSNVAANTAARHSHTNKSLLDTYTQTEVNLADAVAKKHAHANQTALDNVSGINHGDQDLSGLATTTALATTNANVTTNTNAIGTLSSLTTTAKNNLVAAINEVNAKPSGGGSATLYSTTGSNTDGAMTQAATTAALGAKQDTAGAKIYFDSNDFYKDGATSSTALRVKGKADSSTAVYLTTSQTVTNKIVAYTIQALTDGATITWNATSGTIASVTLAGNRTLSITNAIANTYYQIKIKQDATGSRTITWPSIKWIGGTAPTLTTTANAEDIITFWYNGTNYYGNYGLDYK